MWIWEVRYLILLRPIFRGFRSRKMWGNRVVRPGRPGRGGRGWTSVRIRRFSAGIRWFFEGIRRFSAEIRRFRQWLRPGLAIFFISRTRSHFAELAKRSFEMISSSFASSALSFETCSKMNRWQQVDYCTYKSTLRQEINSDWLDLNRDIWVSSLLSSFVLPPSCFYFEGALFDLWIFESISWIDFSCRIFSWFHFSPRLTISFEKSITFFCCHQIGHGRTVNWFFQFIENCSSRWKIIFEFRILPAVFLLISIPNFVPCGGSI